MLAFEPSDSASATDGHNPFSTRRVRPGALEFQFPAETTAATLVDRFETLGSRAQIVGPHGSGKSTLLQTLKAEYERRGRDVTLVTLQAGQRQLNEDETTWQPGSLLIVDGYEQLTAWRRWRLQRLCRRRHVGLLVTTHTDRGLPTLFETAVTPALAVRLVQQLLDGHSLSLTAADIEQTLGRHQGNFRETLFDLYDAYEAAARTDESAG